MNLRHVRTFLAVCDTGSFTAAAPVICRSQPAISRQVHQLEEDLGVKLFDLLGKSLVLTDAGRLFEAEARRLVADANRLVERLGQFHRGIRGRLRLGASSTPAAGLVPAAMADMVRGRPDLELHLEVGPSGDLVERVLNNDLDLIVVGRPPREPKLVSEVVGQDRIGCLGSATGGPDPWHPETLWVLKPAASATRRHAEDWLRSAGIQPRRILELGDAGAITALVAEGVGLTCLSVLVAQDALDHGRLVERDLGLPPLHRELLLVRHAGKHLSPAMAAFLERLRTGAAPVRQDPRSAPC